MSVEFVPGERPRPERVRAHPRAWLAAVATVCFGAFMGQLDASVVALTYRAIGRDFAAPLTSVQWVSLSYLITLGVLLVPLGRASDRLGRKRVYLWGFAAFTASSLGCALAPGLVPLTLLRAVQGAGAAMLQANSIALVSTVAPRDRLRFALGVQAAAQAVGLAIGPTVGGLVVGTIGWRWVFALNVPVGLVALLAGRYLLPRTRIDPDAPPSRLRLVLRRPGVPTGLFGAFLAYLLLFGPIVLVPTVLQAHGMSALVAGAITAAQPVGFAVGAGLSERVLPRGWGSRQRAIAGLLLAGCGLAALVGTGAGLGVFTPANNADVMAAVPAGAAALTGGLVNAARAGGTAVGVAVVAATVGVLAAGRLAALLLLGLTVVALAAAAVRPRAR